MPKFRFLDWDSQFFQFPVGNLALDESDRNFPLSDLLSHCEKTRLLYVISPNEIPSLVANLRDRKASFRHNLLDLPLVSNAAIFEVNTSSSKMVSLAIQSGLYSRFALDPQIPRSKFEELYHLWLVNSLNGSFAERVLASGSANQPDGMVTLQRKGNVSQIGLIAVDSESRGKGIGKNLVLNALEWAKSTHSDCAEVVTQLDNKAAIHLYKSCGYTLIKTEYIYHIWSLE